MSHTPYGNNPSAPKHPGSQHGFRRKLQKAAVPMKKVSAHKKVSKETAPSIVEEKIKLPCGKVNYRRYARGVLLGKGGFARCYLFTCCESQKRWAGKVVMKSSLCRKRAKQKLLGEIRIHRSLSHPHVVKFRNYFEDKDNVYIILEVCHNQTLMELVRRRKRLTEAEVKYYAMQIINALEYLHSHKIIHRDLKLGNLFLDRNLHIKVGDFGLAAKLAHADERKQTICGTPNYIAPEILVNGGRGHSYEVDIWSFGCILYTMLIGKPPFQTRDVKKTYKLIKENTYSFPSHVTISQNAKFLIQWILSTKPEQRPSLAEIKAHPFFAHGVPTWMPLSSLKAAPQLALASLDSQVPRSRSGTNGSGCAAVAPCSVAPCATVRVATGTTEMDLEQDKENVGGCSHAPVAPARTHAADKEKVELQNMHAHLHHSMIGYDNVETKKAAAVVAPQWGAAVPALPAKPGVWITQWVDYSSKYGLGYMMADGSVGVYFNDSSKIVLASNGENFEYMERTRRLRSGRRAPVVRQAHVLSHFPEELNKKVTLLKHFRNHLRDQMVPIASCGPEERAARLRGSVSVEMVYVKKWVRTRHAVLFRVSNRTVQVSFFDKTEVLLSAEGRVVTFRSKIGERTTVTLDEVMKTRPDIAKRLKYTKEILHQLISGARR